MQHHTGIHLSRVLRFVESHEHYSTYRDPDDEKVYLAHGTAKRLVSFDDLIGQLEDLWADFPGVDTEAFADMLRSLTTEPEWVNDEIFFCARCTTPNHQDDGNCTADGDVCESCVDEYWFCNDCENRFRSTTTTLNETEACDTCLHRNWSWCEYCDGYRSDTDYDHDHGSDDDDEDDDDCCESPAMTFTVRNDGEDPLANDTRTAVTLPAGTISDEGLGAIASYLREYRFNVEDLDAREHYYTLSYSLTALGEKWQTKEGNYTKRLSRYAYKTFGLKVPPEVVSRVGCIASDHSTAINFGIEVTRDLNLSAAAFGHRDSCYWQSYSASRCTLKSNGGFGLRTFDGDNVTGRAWVIPLRKNEYGDLTPTFESQEPDAFIVFNGYGALSGYVAARIVSHMAGMTYRKVAFHCGVMYINSDSGYLVAPEEIAEDYTDGSLSLNPDQHSNLYITEKELIHA